MIFIRTLIPDPLLIAYAAIITYAVVCTLLVTPLVRKFALAFRFVDLPNPRRIHEFAIPNIGGVAFAIAFISGLWITSYVHPQMMAFFQNKIVGIVSATTVIVAAGLYDDARGLNFIQKFTIQIIVGSILFYTGYQINSIPTLFWGSINLGWLSFPFTILWVSAVCNAINLIDGLDGLAAGLVSIASAIIFVLSLFQHDIVGSFISLILGGITAAFLYYNFFPAKIFMGDTGSLFLGMILSCLVMEKINFTNSSDQIISSVVILGIPVFDMILTIVRRAIKKRHLFKADRLHIHHRMIDMLGMSHKKAVVTLYGWSIGFGSLGFVISFGNQSFIFFGCVVVMLIVGYATVKLHYFH